MLPVFLGAEGMQINTSRFGPVVVYEEDVLLFPSGLLGLEDCRHWLLLGDGRSDTVAWLQSIEKPQIAMAVVAPRRFVPDFRMRVARAELEPLHLADTSVAEVLVIVGRTDRSITLNLKAPLVINPANGVGRQVITNGDLPIAYELRSGPTALRRIA